MHISSPPWALSIDASLGNKPDPATVLVILEELGLPYQSEFIDPQWNVPSIIDIMNPKHKAPGMVINIQIRTLNLSAHLDLHACSNH